MDEATTRSHELFLVPGKKSRLTVTPDRVTVRVAQCDLELAGVLYAAGIRIAASVSLDRSMRGCFDMRTQRITLATERRHLSTYLKATYDFYGKRTDVS